MTEFELFCKRHRSGMYTIAHSVLFNVQSAEDAVQIAALRIFKVYQNLAFGTDAEERVYALRAAKNAAIDLKRKSKHQSSGIDDAVELESVPSGDTTVQGVTAHALEVLMDQIIESLPNRQRAVLRFRMMGLSYEEIAATLDIDVANARTAAHRARITVARALHEEGFDVE